MNLTLGDQSLDLSRPVIMGILNATKDSFSDGGSYFRGQTLDLDLALRRVEAMIAEGADIIDVGGESTRPGAQAVSLAEERQRVVPLVAAIHERFEVAISVDTSTPEIIQEATEAGAGLINDIRALGREGALAAAAKSGAAVCLMHMQGEPQTMQVNPSYRDVTEEVRAFLVERAAACEAAGIGRDQIILDPGFGFGKTLDHNLQLLRDLSVFDGLGYPILVGFSRKSMIGKLLGREVHERVVASVTLATLAAQRGAKLIRVHDVAATRDALQILAAIEDNARPA
ncbi:dihydropteroate synthase [Gilvimarinus sp. F26214L]|uniref:dihydropteroate synthase n=1 Tax=Gilvimarinus sp. DZF01 TaxID=3461371 RepID=UPI00404653D0